MKLKEYLLEKLIFIGLNIFATILSYVFLISFHVDKNLVLFISLINLLLSNIYFIYDYINKNNYYKNFVKNLDSIDKKYLISDLMDQPNFQEGKILDEVLKAITKSMNDEVLKLNVNINEYKEYIELWVHEVKSPIAAINLIIENNKSMITKTIAEEINRVDNYIEQALFYTRSSNTEKDYVIKKMNLKDVVNKVIRKNATTLIERKIHIETNSLEENIYSDSKWLEFIINQIVANSIRYMNKEEKFLKFQGKQLGDSIVLYIEDNGVGIKEKDIGKVFEKSYTGENGRKFSKSTGIGLYLCKKLCENLGLRITIESRENEYTKVAILFPINKMMIFS